MMTQFKCDRCGKVDELDKALVHITDDGKQTYICKECDSKAGLPSDNTCVCCGEVIPEGMQVCAVCETKNTGDAIARGIIDGINDPCPYVVPPLHINKKKDPHVDIHKIIDDAMEKRDRTVSIYIGEAGVSVTVSPADQDKVHWINDPDKIYDYCSNCGFKSMTRNNATYCGGCGELMHGVRKEDKS